MAQKDEDHKDHEPDEESGYRHSTLPSLADKPFSTLFIATQGHSLGVALSSPVHSLGRSAGQLGNRLRPNMQLCFYQ